MDNEKIIAFLRDMGSDYSILPSEKQIIFEAADRLETMTQKLEKICRHLEVSLGSSVHLSAVYAIAKAETEDT